MCTELRSSATSEHLTSNMNLADLYFALIIIKRPLGP